MNVEAPKIHTKMAAYNSQFVCGSVILDSHAPRLAIRSSHRIAWARHQSDIWHGRCCIVKLSAGRAPGANINNGDITVPVDKLEPPLFVARRPAAAAGASQKKARKTELYNAFDDFRNYQNSLRLKSAYDARCAGRDRRPLVLLCLTMPLAPQAPARPVVGCTLCGCIAFLRICKHTHPRMHTVAFSRPVALSPVSGF